MTDMFADVVTKAEKLAEIEREIAMRVSEADRKMTQAKADRQIAVMRAVLEDVRNAG